MHEQVRLSELTALVAGTIDSVFANRYFWVVADVTDHKFYPGKGHHYFTLVEKDERSNELIARVQSVAWRPGSEKIRNFEKVTGQAFKDDLNVLVKVLVDYHPVYGLKLVLQDIDPGYTIGQLARKRMEILQRLLTECAGFVRKEGERYVTLNNTLELRPVIQDIAVITSLNSAGFQDFRHTLETNSFHYRFRIDTYLAAVQGEENAIDIRRRFGEVIASERPYDAVVVIRGGGAQTDFLIFDTFILGEIVARFPIPVITGIGHQQNETIVDLVAHTPLKTPTKAAEFIIAHNRQFEEAVQAIQKAVIIRTQQLFADSSRALGSFNTAIINHARSVLYSRSHAVTMLAGQVVTRPGMLIASRGRDLSDTVSNLGIFCRNYFSMKKGYIGHYLSLFRAISPENILKKGFALVKREGKIISDPSGIQLNSDISVIFSKMEIISTVKEKKKRNGKETDL